MTIDLQNVQNIKADIPNLMKKVYGRNLLAHYIQLFRESDMQLYESFLSDMRKCPEWSDAEFQNELNIVSELKRL
jgi:hypothetical protein